MKWFKHQSNAYSDSKIKKLIFKYGAEGYAIYFHCLELITQDVSENKLTFELEHDSEIIADNLKIKSSNNQQANEKVSEILAFLVQLNLLQKHQKNDQKKITCLQLLNRFDQSMTSSPSVRKLLSNVSKSNRKHESHDSVMIKLDEVMQEEKRREEKRRDKKETRKEKNTSNKLLSVSKKSPASSKAKSFKKPTLSEIANYVKEINSSISTNQFFDYYESVGWVVGNKPMKDWKATVRTWDRKNKPDSEPKKVFITKDTWRDYE